MKRLLYILFVFILAACSSDDSFLASKTDGDTVDLKFNVTIPEAKASSRAMGDDIFEHLYLLVFEKSGYFAYQAEAKSLSHTGTQNTGLTYTFSVTLKKSSEKRIIHFIATNQTINYSTPGPEYLLKSLTTTGGSDAYWQRRELDNGITDATKLQNVPLVRNFAKIVVNNSSTSGLTNVSYAVMNTLSSGTIVPEIVSDESSFPEFFDSNNASLSYESMLNNKYIGFEDGNATIDNNKAPSDTDFQPVSTSYYMYEHSARETNNTFVIVKGTYDNKEYYYKIDLVYNSNTSKKYYNLLRNFQYTININHVLKAGHNTAEEAFRSPADNNLSASVETKNLSNISDGKSQLLVSFTDTTIVSSDAIYLKYKYIPDISTGTTNNSSVHYLYTENGSTISTVEPVKKNNNLVVDSQGFSSLKITPKDFTGETVSQTIQLYASAPDGSLPLSRDVKITLRDAPTMSIKINNNPIPKEYNSPVELKINLQSGLPKTIFPMVFVIESDANSIYPLAGDYYMPIRIGTSIIPNTTGRNYGFTRTITYDDYDNDHNGVSTSDDGNIKIVACNFKTNIDESATKVYVYNKYCNTTTTLLVNDGGITNMDFKINSKTLKFITGYSNKTIYLYTDANCKENVGSLTTNKNAINKSDITINVPSDIKTLYFKCDNKIGSATIEDIQNASNNNKLTITLN